MSLTAGARLGPYEVVALLGSGGMGEVYKARDTRLDRTVAIKVLPADFAADAERLARFEREAKATAALSHPNILAIHDTGTHDGMPYLVEELLEGESLKDRLGGGPIPVRKAVGLAVQIAHGLAAAHEKHIVHRDLKPANVFLTTDGTVKILDFGLAKLVEEVPPEGSETVSFGPGGATDLGRALGTAGYMAPEQARGSPVDSRTDLFAFGVVLYEMLAGERPFRGRTTTATVAAILTEDAPPLPGRVPPALQRIVSQCLEKRPEDRFSSAHDLALALEAISSSGEPVPGAALARVTPSPRPRRTRDADSGKAAARPPLRRPVLIGALVLAVVGLAYLASSAIQQDRSARWAREVALPKAQQLIAKDDWAGAYEVAVEAERYVPHDPELKAVFSDASILISVTTNPSGAEVFLRPYGSASGAWESIGRTPVESRRISRGFKEYKITKDGCDPATGFTGADQRLPPEQGVQIRLERTLGKRGTVPPEMVRVDGGKYKPTIWYFRGYPEVDLDAFLIDRFETTNRQYQAFVDAGGYKDKRYWKYEFAFQGMTLSWDEAVARFTDKTGRSGPSTWELGHFPEGQEEYPVSGISWFEAAAYAEFAGKRLPTVYQWNKAAGIEDLASISSANTSMIEPVIANSNFGGSGPAPAGRFRGLSPYGAFDMAGNVREWIWNSTPGGRLILGGSWGTPEYLFFEAPEQASPFNREPINGARCVKVLGDRPLPAATTAEVPSSKPVAAFPKPVSDDIFRIYARYYAYDKGPLNAVEETLDASSPYYIRQRVTFNAAYGGERVIAYLFRPRNAKPPFQTVLIFPGSGAFAVKSIDEYASINIGMFTRSGRAVVFPIYKGTFERPRMDDSTPTLWRDHTIMVYKDLARTLDYLETRPEFDHERVAYFGLSWGASIAPIIGALEKRIKLFILEGGGLDQQSLPEIAPVNFAPRHTAPTVIINGRYDVTSPAETSAKPLLELLGTPKRNKALILFDGGHVPPLDSTLKKQMLDCLDRYLGPVR
jgi:eukaryotic-like serine/threonine-protein kinase